MKPINKKILKTFQKIKERSNLSSMIWINQNEFFKEYPKLKKSFKLKLICLKCNNYFERSVWTHLSKNNYNCSYCVGNKKLSFKQFLQKFVQKKLNKKFWILFDENWWCKNYKNTLTKIKLKCKKCKNEFICDVNNLLYQQAGCFFCAQINRSKKLQKITYENFLKLAKDFHKTKKGVKYDYSLITKNWWEENFKGKKRSTRVLIPIICPKHGLFFTTYSKHIHQKSGCPKCYASKGEQKIMNYLIKKNIQFEYQVKIQNFRFDFFLPKLKIFIEYDGKQHFELIEYFGKENFEKTIKNDIQKYYFCKAYGYRLIRFDYIQFKNLEKYLELNFKKL